MNYNHLTIEERDCIKKFKEMNVSIREMAKLLGRNVSTISRELKRNSYVTGCNYSVKLYQPIHAQKQYNKRRESCHRKTKITIEIKTYIEEKIHINWSPEQIVNYKEDKPINFPIS